MSKSLTELADTLYTLASSELFAYKGVLSCIRLLVIDYKNDRLKNNDVLFEKQKSYMNRVDIAHDEYISALEKVENEELKMALSFKSPAITAEYSEFSQVFTVLSERRAVIEKISELNTYLIERSTQLSFDCKDRIKDIKKQKKFSTNVSKKQNIKAGSLFNYKEKH